MYITKAPNLENQKRLKYACMVINQAPQLGIAYTLVYHLWENMLFLMLSPLSCYLAVSQPASEFECSHCSYSTPSAALLQSHMTHTHRHKAPPTTTTTAKLPCPLCSVKVINMEKLETHLFAAHNVNKEGSKRLISLMDTSSWKTADTRELFPLAASV